MNDVTGRCVCVDNTEFNAQISASLSRRLRQPQVGGRVTDGEFQDVYLRRDEVYCRYRLPESPGMYDACLLAVCLP